MNVFNSLASLAAAYSQFKSIEGTPAYADLLAEVPEIESIVEQIGVAVKKVNIKAITGDVTGILTSLHNTIDHVPVTTVAALNTDVAAATD